MLGEKKRRTSAFLGLLQEVAKGRQVRENTRIQYTMSNEKT